MKFMIRSLQALILILTLLWGVSAAMGASATPSSVNAAYGQSTTVTVHYMLPPAFIPITNYTSTAGYFYLPSSPTPIGTVNLSLVSTTRHASEVLTIPQAVIERALRAGANSFYYQRIIDSNPSAYGDTFNLTINITPGSAAAFSLRRIELFFDTAQKQNEVMVTRNFKGLRAYADLFYNGSGLLNGYWEVDGLIIERVNRFLPPSGKITLATPVIPDLPTFDPGYHIVKFIVTNPLTSFEVPEMVYWVKGTEEPMRRVLTLSNPEDGAIIPTDYLFEWKKTENASVYLISFAKAEDKKVCFSAMTRDTSYRIPSPVLSEYLCPGGKYLWSVKGYDTESNVIAESDLRRFSFIEANKP